MAKKIEPVGFFYCTYLLLLLVLGSISALSHNETENEVQSCYKQWICNSIISKPLMDIKGQAEDKENLCHTLYNCHHRKFITGETVEDVLDHIVDLERKRKKRSTRGLLFGRPFRKPPNSKRRPECQKCEKKRSSCTNFYIATYGICGGAYLVGGNTLSTGCNLLTIPRTVDCMLNTYFNCYLKHCGLVGI